MPARTFAVFMSLEPAFAAFSGFVLLNERLSAAQASGIAMVALATAGAAWTTSENREISLGGAVRQADLGICTEIVEGPTS